MIFDPQAGTNLKQLDLLVRWPPGNLAVTVPIRSFTLDHLAFPLEVAQPPLGLVVAVGGQFPVLPRRLARVALNQREDYLGVGPLAAACHHLGGSFVAGHRVRLPG